MDIIIRPARPADHDAIWEIIAPVIRAGETYALPRDMTRDAAMAYWTGPDKECFVAERDGAMLGSYYLRPNQQGGGAHIANCGYITRAAATGQGTARAMCEHSLAHARERGYRAMQFNFVLASNHRAAALWQSLGFATIGRIPEAFRHPCLGMVDALVMHRKL